MIAENQGLTGGGGENNIFSDVADYATSRIDLSVREEDGTVNRYKRYIK